MGCHRLPSRIVPLRPPVRGQERCSARLPISGLPAPLRSPAIEINERLFRAARQSLSDALLLAGKGEGGGKKGSLRARCCTSSPPAELPEGARAGPGLVGWQHRQGDPYPGASG